MNFSKVKNIQNIKKPIDKQRKTGLENAIQTFFTSQPTFHHCQKTVF